MFFFLFNEFYKSTYKYSFRNYKNKLSSRLNGFSTNGAANGSVNQYYDSINHNNHHHTNNNKKDFDYSSSYFNDTNDLVNRKKAPVQN